MDKFYYINSKLMWHLTMHCLAEAIMCQQAASMNLAGKDLHTMAYIYEI
jgi:hypothetical protein